MPLIQSYVPVQSMLRIWLDHLDHVGTDKIKIEVRLLSSNDVNLRRKPHQKYLCECLTNRWIYQGF